jgi:hypothetical protein
VADNHDHIVCRTCGAVADVDCRVGAAPCLAPAEHHGYAIDEAEVIYWGICPDCLRPDRLPPGGATAAAPATTQKCRDTQQPPSLTDKEPRVRPRRDT